TCSGIAMNASPARTMIRSERSTQPPSPTAAVANRPRRSPVPGSILKTNIRRPTPTPSRWKRGMMRSSAKRKVNCGASYSGLMLLPLRPHPHVAVLVNFDVDDVRAAADGAILDVLLARPCRQVDGHDDLLATGVAGVAGLVFHRSASHPLHLVAHAFHPGSQSVTLIAPNVNHALLDPPAGCTGILELRGKFEQTGFIKWDIGYGRHALATPAFGFPTQADHGSALLGHFLLRYDRLDGDLWRVRYPLSASTDQASRQVHDFTLD